MARVAWINDIHLDWLEEPARAAFFATIVSADPQAVLIGGDIAHAVDLAECLEQMAATLKKPVFFVLGNHDYYGGAIGEVRQLARRICRMWSEGQKAGRHISGSRGCGGLVDFGYARHSGWCHSGLSASSRALRQRA